MAREIAKTLVSTEWLAEHLSAPDVRVVDATWFMPDSGRDARAEYEAEHIPGAVFFDIDEIADTASPLPHTIAPMHKFVSRTRKLGLGDGYQIIVYDRHGLFSAARVWWMFRFFGHEAVAVLDGGLPKWLEEGRPVDDLPPMPRERHFTGKQQSMLMRDTAQVARAIKRRDAQILDARSPERFSGSAPEPRPGLRAGHMPGALNVHYSTLLNVDGTMKDEAGLRRVFADAGVDLGGAIITSCGSGVTAAIISLSLEVLGTPSSLYDGSWCEWGSYSELPVETSA